LSAADPRDPAARPALFDHCSECGGSGVVYGWRYVVGPDESHIYPYRCAACGGTGRARTTPAEKRRAD
jgi:DnaJ-class molecular chaperone